MVCIAKPCIFTAPLIVPAPLIFSRTVKVEPLLIVNVVPASIITFLALTFPLKTGIGLAFAGTIKFNVAPGILPSSQLPQSVKLLVPLLPVHIAALVANAFSVALVSTTVGAV